MSTRIVEILRGYLPTHVEDPVGTVLRVLRSRNRAAFSAVAQTFAGIAAIPVDLLLSVLEKNDQHTDALPRHPIVFVCGPSRSGTSIVAQVLIRQLPVSYFSNTVAIFPRAPITASRLLSFAVRNNRVRFQTYYSKSRGLSGPNDAQALWDRWFGKDRTGIPATPGPREISAMQAFFGEWQAQWPKPLVTKNNRLYIYGADVAAALPTATFICLQRDPVFHAQSQLIARRAIFGRDDRPYGPMTPDYLAAAKRDRPAEDACILVSSYREQVRRTQQQIGKDRFWVLSYDQFCRDPNVLLDRLAREVLKVRFKPLSQPLTARARRSLDENTFSTIRSTCEHMGLSGDETPYFS